MDDKDTHLPDYEDIVLHEEYLTGGFLFLAWGYYDCTAPSTANVQCLDHTPSRTLRKTLPTSRPFLERGAVSLPSELQDSRCVLLEVTSISNLILPGRKWD